TANVSPVGRTATSSRSFDTSMPTTMASILSRPCASGLRWRPKRLFGFDGTTGEDPNSPTGLASLGGIGLSPATAQAILPESATTELQGGATKRSSHKLKSRRRYGRTDRSSSAALASACGAAA